MNPRKLFRVLVIGGAILAISALGCSGNESGSDAAGPGPDAGGEGDSGNAGPDASSAGPDASSPGPDASTAGPDAGSQPDSGFVCMCVSGSDWQAGQICNGCCCWLTSACTGGANSQAAKCCP
jgi:hypothetical protein